MSNKIIKMKKISDYAAEQRKALTIKEFYKSPLVTRYIADSCFAIGNTGDYRMSVYVRIPIEEEPEAVAYTDGKTVTLFPQNDFFPTDLEENVEAVMGVAAHEMAHRFFTGFNELKTAQEKIRKSDFGYFEIAKVTSDPDCIKGWEKIKQFAKTREGAHVLISLFHDIHNVVEDGFIEDQFLTQFNGEMADALIFTRQWQFYGGKTIAETSEMVEERKKTGAKVSQWAVTTGFILQYAKYGKFLCGTLKELADPILVHAKNSMELVDSYMNLGVGHQPEKMFLSMAILAKNWDIIANEAAEATIQVAALSALLSELGEMQSSSIGGMSNIPMNISGNGNGCSDDGEEDDENESKNNKGSKSERQKASEETKEKIQEAESGKDGKGTKDEKSKNKGEGKDKNGEGDDKDEGAGANGEGTNNSSDNTEDNGTPTVKDTAPNKQKVKGRNSEKKKENIVQKVHDEEGGRIDNTGIDGDNTDDGTGRVDNVTDGAFSYDTAADDIKRLIDDVIHEKALEAAESDVVNRMRKDAKAFKLDGIHKNVDITLHRTAKISEEMISQYKECSAPLLAISKKLQKELLKRLKEVKKGYKMTGLISGKRLNSSALYRSDMKIFSNTKLPQEKSKIAVGILIDESGSMSCGKRSTSARAAAIVLEDFCRGLGIPCCIYGHTESHNVELYNYVSFDNVDSKDCYRLMGISARSGNRDGAALAFVGREVQKRPEESKILIIISDGQPAANNYYGEAAEADLRSIKKSLNREGIALFAAAIGDDKENIHRIYGDGFLDITNLEDMPKQLVNLIVRFCKF